MFVEKIIDEELKPLSPSDTVAETREVMQDWQSDTLPVVEPATRKLTGQIHIDQLAGLEGEVAVSELSLEGPASIFPHQHIFEATRQMLMHEASYISVIDRDQTYQGVVTKKRVLEVLADMLNISASGSVISVEVEPNDYSLSELIYLIESENARILGVTVEAPDEDNDHYLVSFKLNLNDTSGISQSLRRHDYRILSESHSELLQFDMTDRADELMRYLDV